MLSQSGCVDKSGGDICEQEMREFSSEMRGFEISKKSFR